MEEQSSNPTTQSVKERELCVRRSVGPRVNDYAFNEWTNGVFNSDACRTCRRRTVAQSPNVVDTSNYTGLTAGPPLNNTQARTYNLLEMR